MNNDTNVNVNVIFMTYNFKYMHTAFMIVLVFDFFPH